ncbi:hypothetical protein ACUNV4_16165 [Granulosicoccus sp. 3-233]|uniref:hypothetical protein n=1 Tax=Granulosicoccus sp. 3-233 TaxID=3417969 RepID=UPI003D329A77
MSNQAHHYLHQAYAFLAADKVNRIDLTSSHGFERDFQEGSHRSGMAEQETPNTDLSSSGSGLNRPDPEENPQTDKRRI